MSNSLNHQFWTQRADFVPKTPSCFSPGGPHPIQNKSPTQKIDTSTDEEQNGPLNPPPACLGLGDPNLQILRIRDLPDMSTNFIMSFHNHASILIHWFSWVQQNFPWLALRTIFCRLAQPLFRGKVLRSLCILCKSWSTVFACVRFP